MYSTYIQQVVALEQKHADGNIFPLFDGGSMVLEAMAINTGFRNIAIRGGQILVNGNPISIKGGWILLSPTNVLTILGC